jgi:glucose-fructose oxidoreductase
VNDIFSSYDIINLTKQMNSSRRYFIKSLGQVTAAGLILPTISMSLSAQEKRKEKVGIALVGLGNYSTSMPAKAEKWSAEYNLNKKNIYNYQNFDEIAKNKDIDIIYIVLPTSMHAEYTIRALKAGKHVICEKPMALNAAEARTMIDAAKKANKKLSIGYRMHYDPFFKEVKRLGQKEELGSVNYMECSLGYFSTPSPDAWRLKKAMGGGDLYNLAVYPIQSARFTKGSDPLYVTAQAITKRKDIFKEVPESFTWQFEWADGTICNSYAGSSGQIDRLFAACSDGYIELNPATGYSGQAGGTSRGKFEFQHVFQQKLQIEDFARCVLEDKESMVKAEMGLQDMIIIDAIQESIRTGQRVKISIS